MRNVTNAVLLSVLKCDLHRSSLWNLPTWVKASFGLLELSQIWLVKIVITLKCSESPELCSRGAAIELEMTSRDGGKSLSACQSQPRLLLSGRVFSFIYIFKKPSSWEGGGGSWGWGGGGTSGWLHEHARKRKSYFFFPVLKVQAAKEGGA